MPFWIAAFFLFPFSTGALAKDDLAKVCVRKLYQAAKQGTEAALWNTLLFDQRATLAKPEVTQRVGEMVFGLSRIESPSLKALFCANQKEELFFLVKVSGNSIQPIAPVALSRDVEVALAGPVSTFHIDGLFEPVTEAQIVLAEQMIQARYPGGIVIAAPSSPSLAWLEGHLGPTPIFFPSGVYPPAVDPNDVTEYSLQLMQHVLRHREEVPQRILVLGTGSGFDAITLASKTTARIDAVDISEAAVDVARFNVRLNQLYHRVRVMRSDLFSAVPGETYDWIVFAAPRPLHTALGIPEAALSAPDFFYDPRLWDRRGTLTERLLREAPGYLRPGGSLFIMSDEHLERLLPRGMRAQRISDPQYWSPFDDSRFAIFRVLPPTGIEPVISD